MAGWRLSDNLIRKPGNLKLKNQVSWIGLGGSNPPHTPLGPPCCFSLPFPKGEPEGISDDPLLLLPHHRAKGEVQRMGEEKGEGRDSFPREGFHENAVQTKIDFGQEWG